MRTSSWAPILTKPVSTMLEFRPADWPEKYHGSRLLMKSRLTRKKQKKNKNKKQAISHLTGKKLGHSRKYPFRTLYHPLCSGQEILEIESKKRKRINRKRKARTQTFPQLKPRNIYRCLLSVRSSFFGLSGIGRALRDIPKGTSVQAMAQLGRTL